MDSPRGPIGKVESDQNTTEYVPATLVTALALDDWLASVYPDEENRPRAAVTISQYTEEISIDDYLVYSDQGDSIGDLSLLDYCKAEWLKHVSYLASGLQAMRISLGRK